MDRCAAHLFRRDVHLVREIRTQDYTKVTSDVDDVDLECCWRSPDRAFDCRDCETFVEMIMRRLTRTVACG